jgi:hypothetical protein
MEVPILLYAFTALVLTAISLHYIIFIKDNIKEKVPVFTVDWNSLTFDGNNIAYYPPGDSKIVGIPAIGSFQMINIPALIGPSGPNRPNNYGLIRMISDNVDAPDPGTSLYDGTMANFSTVNYNISDNQFVSVSAAEIYIAIERFDPNVQSSLLGAPMPSRNANPKTKRKRVKARVQLPKA